MEMAQEKKDRVVLLSKASGAGDGYYPVAAARAQDLRRQITGVVESEGSTQSRAQIADKLSGKNDASELQSSPYAVQILVEGAKASDPIPLAPGGGGGGAGNLSAVLGTVVTSTAITALASGAVSPAVAFGSFLVLLGGVALVMASVRATV